LVEKMNIRYWIAALGLIGGLMLILSVALAMPIWMPVMQQLQSKTVLSFLTTATEVVITTVSGFMLIVLATLYALGRESARKRKTMMIFGLIGAVSAFLLVGEIMETLGGILGILSGALSSEDFRRGMKPQLSEAKFMLRRIKKSPLSIAGMAIILFFVLIAALAPVLAPPVTRDPYMIWKDGVFVEPRPPGSAVIRNKAAVEKGWTTHLFGTTSGQYDIYYGIIWGTITAFRVGILVVGGALIIGCALGIIAGYYGGVVDELMMRFTDIIFAFPGLILAMALVLALPPKWYLDMFLLIFSAIGFIVFALLGSKLLKLTSGKSLAFGFLGFIIFAAIDILALKSPPIWSMFLPLTRLEKCLVALTIVGWPGYTRLLRGEVLRIKQEDYIEAAKAVGCSDLRIMYKHMLPNAIYPILISASLDIGAIVLTAAALSFLNIGSPIGYADWGQMIAFAQNYFNIKMTSWYAFFIPGFFIVLFVLGWNLIGDAFRDILDPTLRRR